MAKFRQKVIDNFLPFLRFFKKTQQNFFRPEKGFLAWFELHWTYNSRKN